MARYTVIYDANVLFPQTIRDCLMSLAVTGLFRAFWTDKIHDEWIRNVHDQRALKKKIFYYWPL